MESKPWFALNGRFLTQNLTGVQRYAWNVAYHLNEILGAANQSAPILTPNGATDPNLSRMPLVEFGRVGGHAWEQFILPARWRGDLLNLCNIAPVIKSRQVLCIHDANVFIRPESYSTSFRIYYRGLQTALARRASRITSVSTDSAAQIARHLPLKMSDIIVLPNGHEHALAWDPQGAQSAPSILNNRRAGAGRPFVLALGSRAPHKNLRLVMDIAPRLGDAGIDVIIVGGSAKIYSDDALTGGENVHFTGRMDDNDLAFLLERALCLLFPSWTEGFGLPILEAMTRGCPVISSDRASMPEVCGDAALMAAPDDPMAWVRHIERLRSSTQLRSELIAAGRQRINRFSWKTTAQAYAQLMRG
ncbi:glycosyltransferase family 4 protein [Methylobacterium sp. E-005]|uniref:glycosyltransferase family 4 protein n=1 Tax=Methylobacterium sp. E-005 TaxID=2836549 RepID=UPI001FBAD84A|nr:glycosyltransferase family 1 protein [Methylobacterium sp. E-005]MCJ2086922.1 glycosyltransferase family 4 protein [Methylobacterium sp. E-005]